MSTGQVTKEELEKVFELLKRQGPLSESQIAVELLMPGLEHVHAICASLLEKHPGLVARRPDKDHPSDDDDPVWGIRTDFWNVWRERRGRNRAVASGEA